MTIEGPSPVNAAVPDPDVIAFGPPPQTTSGRRRLLVAVAVVIPILLLAAGAFFALHPEQQGQHSRATTTAPHPSPTASKPVSIPPAVGDCFPANALGDSPELVRLIVRPGHPTVPCTESHLLETVAVGSVTTLPTVPAVGSDPATDRLLLAQCGQTVDAYLGGDWRTSLVLPIVLLPNGWDWGSGARWYACAAMYDDGLTGYGTPRAGTLRDGLRGSRPVALTCLDFTLTSDDQIRTTRPVPCAQRHLAEFTGVYEAPDGSWPGYDKLATIADYGCADVTARYLGFSSARKSVTSYLSSWYWWVSEAEWDVGVRSMRCLAIADSWPTPLTGSVKGIRSGKPHH